MMIIMLIQFVCMGGSVDTIYRESSPFCWSPQLIGFKFNKISILSKLKVFEIF